LFAFRIKGELPLPRLLKNQAFRPGRDPGIANSVRFQNQYFSDGLTEILTGDLSKISSLFVIASNSAFTYKGKAVKVQDVGREMGVRYVILIQASSAASSSGRMAVSQQSILQGGYLDELLYAAA
jgi:hypothetical protein